MSQKSSEMKAQGIDVINLSVGEPDFNTPDGIKESAKQAIDDNWSKYSPVPGYPGLRKAIAAKLKNENHLDYAISEILQLCSATLSVRRFDVVQWRGVSFRRSATCRMSRYSRAVIEHSSPIRVRRRRCKGGSRYRARR